MSNFCIPKNIALKLKESAKRGEIKIEELYRMNSEQRRAFFQEYTDEETAKGINAGFEKAILSQQQSALKTWVKNTFSIKEKAKRKDVIDRIDSLSKTGALSPAQAENFLQDLVAQKLGVTVTAEEAQKINELSGKLEEAYNKPVDKFGVADISYFQKRREMENYLKSLVPSSNLKVLTSTVGRGSMLLNIKSSITNIVGNTVQGIEQSLERRIANRQYSGKVDKSLIKEYFKKANEIYQKTGYDITRMYTYSEGIKTLGEETISSQGKGAIRKLGRFYEDLVFKQMLGAPDVAFSSANFADSANLMATKIAKQEGLKGEEQTERANELFLDATSINPSTLEGEAIRAQAIADAEMATFQNESNYSSVALGIRKLFNQATGDLRLGDQIMPFVKTPANVVGFSLDAGGLGAIRAIYNLPGAISEMKAGNPTSMRNVARDMSRTGLGLLVSFILSSLIDPEDFIGKYPTSVKEQELLKLGNARENSIKIGDKWVSLDYFGFLGAPLVGFLYAKKYPGESMTESMYSYGSGVATQSVNIPGFDQIKDIVDSASRLKPEEGKTLTEIGSEALQGAIDFVRARAIPGIVYDIAKGIDASEREVDWKNPLDKIKAGIPGLRQTLPEKLDVFGDVIKGEPFYSSVLFGARVKTSRDNAIITELKRLDEAGQLPSLTRPEKTSSRVKELREQIGEQKFSEAMNYFRNKYKEDTIRLIESSRYKKMSDEDKKKALDSIKDESLERMLKRYGYKKKT